jgi:hypothetical protein
MEDVTADAEPGKLAAENTGNLPYIKSKSFMINQFFTFIDEQVLKIGSANPNDRGFMAISFLKNLLKSKLPNFKYIVNLVNFIYLFGYLEYMDILFEMLKHTKDESLTRVATKIKHDTQNVEIMPLIRTGEKDQGTELSRSKVYSAYIELFIIFRDHIKDEKTHLKSPGISDSGTSSTDKFPTKKKLSKHQKCVTVYRGFKILLNSDEKELSKKWLVSACSLCFKAVTKFIEGGYTNISSMKLKDLLMLSKLLGRIGMDKLANRIQFFIVLSQPKNLGENYLIYKAFLKLINDKDCIKEIENLAGVILKDCLCMKFNRQKDPNYEHREANKIDIYEFLVQNCRNKKMENYISQASLFQKFEKIHYDKLAGVGEEEISPLK